MSDNKNFKNDAKMVVDALFNAKVFKDDVTRDEMIKTEELIDFMMSSSFESHIKIQKFLDKQ